MTTNGAAVELENVNNSSNGNVDYVLAYKAEERSLAVLRQLFEEAMKREQLVINKERIGGEVFVKISTPNSRLAVEAERIKLEMPLKGCEIVESNTGWMSWFGKKLSTDDEVDFVSAPFQVSKCRLFVGCDENGKLDGLFRSSLRQLLTHNILINLDIHEQLFANLENQSEERSHHKNDQLKKRGLLYLLMKGAYADHFVLHDPSELDPYFQKLKRLDSEQYLSKCPKLQKDDRKALYLAWKQVLKFQPLWKIRNYFGEKIAFYFAWIGTFITLLWLPAGVGGVIFINGLAISAKNGQLRSCSDASTSKNMTSPASVSTTTVTVGGTTTRTCGVLSRSKLLAEDAFGFVKDSFDNKYSPVYAMAICLWGILFVELWKRRRSQLAYQWDVDLFAQAEPDRPEFIGTKQTADPITGQLSWIYPQSWRVRKFAISAIVVSIMVMLVFISVSSVILYKEWNQKLFCWTFTTVAPTLMNAMSIMFLGFVYERIARKLTQWENHRSQSAFNDALIIKLFAFQFANTYASLFYIAFVRPEENGFQDNGIFGLGPAYKDTCRRGHCMTLLAFQIFVLMLIKPFPKLFKDLVLPIIKRRARKVASRMARQLNKSNNVGAAGGVESAVAGSSRRKTKMPASSRRDNADYVDNFIERTYLKYPLNDFTLWEYNEKVIQYGYIMMFAASFPLAPMLALLVNMIDIRVDGSRLLWWNRRPVAFIASNIGMWLHIIRFVSYCGVVTNAFIIAYTSNFCQLLLFDDDNSTCTVAQRITIALVFEHIGFALMYLLSILIPDVPASVQLAQRQEHYQVPLILEKGALASHNSGTVTNGPTPTNSNSGGTGSGNAQKRPKRRRKVSRASQTRQTYGQTRSAPSKKTKAADVASRLGSVPPNMVLDTEELGGRPNNYNNP